MLLSFFFAKIHLSPIGKLNNTRNETRQSYNSACSSHRPFDYELWQKSYEYLCSMYNSWQCCLCPASCFSHKYQRHGSEGLLIVVIYLIEGLFIFMIWAKNIKWMSESSWQENRLIRFKEWNYEQWIKPEPENLWIPLYSWNRIPFTESRHFPKRCAISAKRMESKFCLLSLQMHRTVGSILLFGCFCSLITLRVYVMVIYLLVWTYPVVV